MQFAHFSDVHLGFQKEEFLQRMEQDVFARALDDCIGRSVDFILICGDMFHVNIPSMHVQKFAFAMLRRVHEAGIPVYVVYGSHDFSPSATSVIDLLEETGYITKVQKAESGEGGDISLGFVTDEKTGAKMAGLHGRAASKDVEYYERLRREELESEPGFKIFLFHGAVSDMRTDDAVAAATAETAMPLSYMPRGFAYYAGGHMHRFSHRTFDGYAHVVYPGTPFAGFYPDLEENARGAERGYALVEFDHAGGVRDVQQIVIPNCEYEMLSIRADHRRSDAVNDEIVRNVNGMDPAGKVVMLKVAGRLSEGKTTDIDFKGITDRLLKDGAAEVKISSNQLSSAEYEIRESRGGTAEEIAGNAFKENIGQVDSELDALTGRKGIELAEGLLDVLRRPVLENEPLNVYRGRITEDAIKTLGLPGGEEEG